MTSRNKLVFFVALAILAAACGGTTDSSEGKAGSGLGGGEGRPACSGPTPMCAAGTTAVDTNGDGCVDGCAAPSCGVADLCAEHSKQVDRDGDGCNDACEPNACPPIAPPTRPLGQKPADTNDDGCVDGCEPANCPVAILCQAGFTQVDTDGDGCEDAWQLQRAPAVRAHVSTGAEAGGHRRRRLRRRLQVSGACLVCFDADRVLRRRNRR